jgi:hypothetical protein
VQQLQPHQRVRIKQMAKKQITPSQTQQMLRKKIILHKQR